MTLTWAGAPELPQLPFGRLFRCLYRPVPENAGIVTAYTDGQVTLRSNRAREGYHEAADLSSFQGVEVGDFVVHGLDILRGSVGISDSAGAMSPVVSVCEPIGPVDLRFVSHVIRTQAATGFTRAMARGIREGGADFRRWGTLAELPIPVPSLDYQRRVCDFLDRETARIDTVIEEQQRLVDVLRERRSAVLSAAFKLGPSTATTKVGRLLSARPSYGVLVPRYVDETDGVPFIRVGNLLNFAKERPLLAIAPEQSNEYSRTKIGGGEVLLGVVGKMGQAVVAPHWLAGANVARAVAVLRCRDAAVAPLLCAWLGSNEFLRQAELATSGDSIQPTLGMKDLARFDISLPTHPHASADLTGQMANIDMLIAETERFIELVGERRAALITAAVTGQIDVREAA